MTRLSAPDNFDACEVESVFDVLEVEVDKLDELKEPLQYLLSLVNVFT